MKDVVVTEFEKTHGTLEGVRLRLGLNKKQMAQLLGVDPSAWTRWTARGSDAPAHIYQALSWYLQLIERAPQVHESFEVQRLQSEVRRLEKKLQQTASSIELPQDFGLPHEWQEEKKTIFEKIENQQAIGSGWKLLLMLNLALLFYLILIRL